MEKCTTCNDSVRWQSGGRPANGRYVHATRGNICTHLVRATRALNDTSAYNPDKIPPQHKRKRWSAI